jgi:hypothetical protein
MFNTNQNILNNKENQWRGELDQFAQNYAQELAALVWGLSQEWEDKTDTLGIDLKPKPHFVVCERKAIEELNQKVNGNLQEILGILDGYDPEKETVIIGIGEGQIKLINYEPKIAPKICFNQLDVDIETLINDLENKMLDKISALP